MSGRRIADPTAASVTHDREVVSVFAGVGLAVAALHLAGAITGSGALWGVHAYAFLPGWALALGLGALGLGVWTLGRAPSRPRIPASQPGRVRLNARGTALAIVPAAVGAGALFHALRTRHLLLGDGYALAEALPQAARFHPYEPLAAAVHRLAFDGLAPALAGGREPWLAAWEVVAWVSVVAGALFVPLAYGIARELARFGPGGAAGAGRGLVLVVAGLLLTQGYVQLFFGYVEVYALAALGVAVYLYAALRGLHRTAPLWLSGAALVAAIGLHLSAAVLVPSWLVLAARELRDPGTRAAALRDLAVTGALVVALALLLARAGAGYDVFAALRETGWAAITRRHELIPDYFASWMHLRDFANAQLLIGPWAAALFVPAAFLALVRGLHARAPALFWITAAGGYLGVYALAGDSNLGYARNWDLFAPAGLVLTAAGLGLVLLLASRPEPIRRALLAALAVSLFHTGAWVALNASAEASRERFARLPLGLGRVESTLAYASAREGRFDEAERWIQASLARNPGNVRAFALLGDIHRHHARFGPASLAYKAASEIRPDVRAFRVQLVDCLVRAGRPRRAEFEIRELIEREPGEPRLWTAYGVILMGLDREDEARRAMEHAVELDPALTPSNRALAALRADWSYDRMRSQLWPGLLDGIG